MALLGEQEIQEGMLTLKEMESGQQERLSPEELVERLSSVK